MDLLTTIATCSLANDFTLVFAMAMSFSQGNPYTVKDATEVAAAPLYGTEIAPDASDDRASATPRTREEAVAALKRFKADGPQPLIGLLPVPAVWAGQFQRKPTDLLDACVNVSIASAMVSEFEEACGPKAGRACVLQRYAKAAGIEMFAQDVLELIRTQGLPKTGAAVVETDDVFDAPVFADDPKRDWGADKIFFVTAHPKQQKAQPLRQ
jgi:hypothetical protein